MAQIFILLIIIELILSGLIIYFLIKAGNYIKTTRIEVMQLKKTIPQSLQNLRNELNNININLKKENTVKPFSSQEIGFIAGNIFGEILLSRVKIMPNKKFFIIPMLIKLWKHRKRIKATILQPLTSSIS